VNEVGQISILDILVNEPPVIISAEMADESLNELIETISPYEIGDRVQIVIPVQKRKDPESFFYLQDFSKKRGVVLRALTHAKLQYEVEVGTKIAIVYHEELMVGWPS